MLTRPDRSMTPSAIRARRRRAREGWVREPARFVAPASADSLPACALTRTSASLKRQRRWRPNFRPHEAFYGRWIGPPKISERVTVGTASEQLPLAAMPSFGSRRPGGHAHRRSLIRAITAKRSAREKTSAASHAPAIVADDDLAERTLPRSTAPP